MAALVLQITVVNAARRNDKMAGIDCEIKLETRLCIVANEYGWFHVWELYSQPLEASPMIGGAPAGVFSRIFGIVEFADGIRRVDPTDIYFCDEDNEALKELNKTKEGKINVYPSN